MEESIMMEKITYEKACKLLKEGKQVKCRISLKELVNVKDQNDLDNKKHLGKQNVQEFDLYYENIINEVPKNAIEITIDEAFELVNSDNIICCAINGKEEKIANIGLLSSIIRSAKVRREKPVMYWYV